MRMNKLVVGLLVLGLAVAMIGLAGFAQGKASVTNKVSWKMLGFVELKIEKSAFDFGTIPAGTDKVVKNNANALFVYSNTNWVLAISSSGKGADYLKVGLSATSGRGDKKVSISYTLLNLRELAPGNYYPQVTYTVTTK